MGTITFPPTTDGNKDGVATPMLTQTYELIPVEVEVAHYDDPAKVMQIAQWCGASIADGVWEPRAGEWPQDAEKIAKGIAIEYGFRPYESPLLILSTLLGDQVAKLGDFIVQGCTGSFHVCTPEQFALAYRAKHPVIVQHLHFYGDVNQVGVESSHLIESLSGELVKL